MNDEKYRINSTTRVMMLVVAVFFDCLQLLSKLFYLFGILVAGAVVGATVGGEIGAAVGAFVAGLIGFIPFAGQAIAISVGIAMAEAFSWIVTITAYFTLWLWLKMHDVSILEGNQTAHRMTVFTVSLVVEIAPMLNALPSITWWTWRMIQSSREEDKEKAEKEGVKKKGGSGRFPERDLVTT